MQVSETNTAKTNTLKLDPKILHHSEFSDLEALLRLKKAQNLTITVVLPTLNEEPTVGEIIETLRRELIEEIPLLDNLAVVDSGSTDKTRTVAANAGAQVFKSCDILPEYGSVLGKGENLWKALYALPGDIICYLDTDTKNFRSHFASALIAPLLQYNEVQYVKAFYNRPLASENSITPNSGGRVTEILIRPLLGLFFPELSHLIQPLSGEYAARRSLLETLSFPTGYSVETSHLLDICYNYGAEVIAQVDLDCRIHHNQPTPELGKMAFSILHTFFNRLNKYKGMESPDLLESFKQFLPNNTPTIYVNEEIERPPMGSIAEYRKKFSL